MECIIANYTSSPDNLNPIICEFIEKVFNYVNRRIMVLEDVELVSIFTIAQNAYINNESLGAISGQVNFVNLLIQGIKKIAPLDIPQYIANIEDNITKSKLSQEEKMPLFFATSVGIANYNYWMTAIADTESGWQRYFNSNAAVNIANVPFWVSATMQATLYFCFKGNYFTGEAEPPKMAGPDFVTALTASLAVGAGKVIYGWVQKLKLTAINNFGTINGRFASNGNACNCNKTKSFDFNKNIISNKINPSLLSSKGTNRQWVPYNDSNIFEDGQASVSAVDRIDCAGWPVPKAGYELINEKLMYDDLSAIHCANGGDFYITLHTGEIAIFGQDFVNNPVLGTGTYGSLGLVFDVTHFNGMPNQCLTKDLLNQYLAGARAVYKSLHSGLAGNEIISVFQLGRYKECINTGSYIECEIAMPIVYQISTWACTSDIPD